MSASPIPHRRARCRARCRAVCHALGLATTLALAGAALPARAGCEAVPGALACKDLGNFLASAVRVNVTQKQGGTAYQGVRTLIRLHNVGSQPLLLGYRDASSRVTDNNGNVYAFGRTQVQGIGIVGRQGADAQFALSPGEAREFTLENTLQYASARVVAGNIFSHDFTLVEMAAASPTQVRMVRDHAVSFADLMAGAPGAAARLVDALRNTKKH